ncbi:hypothetical protein D3C73_1183160 [compost metagenome]
MFPGPNHAALETDTHHNNLPWAAAARAYSLQSQAGEIRRRNPASQPPHPKAHKNQPSSMHISHRLSAQVEYPLLPYAHA